MLANHLPMQPVRPPLHFKRREATKVQDSMKPAVTWVAVLTALVGALALLGTLFLWTQKNAGRAYREAYLQTFGFRADALPWNTDDLALLGYFAQADVVLLMLGLFIALALLGAVLAIAGDYLSRRFFKEKESDEVKDEDKKRKGEKKFTIPPAATIYWSIAVVLMTFSYFNLIPIALFQKMKTKGVRDAQNQIGLIETLEADKFKEGGINFVEIAREKSEPVWGAAISCTEKFCALYSPVGPVHARIVPLTDVKMWSTLDWADVAARKKAETDKASKQGQAVDVARANPPTWGTRCVEDEARVPRRVPSGVSGQRSNRT
ncbi:hypothetical protein [Ralstonia wenshanensis]|uniref:hypothetical protein n=1 Tax=Ralstonia wenshanensis TaxID=2842456 RepID=UPI00292CE664|nr:hypothetical protein [Ralstonia wenshanensis]